MKIKELCLGWWASSLASRLDARDGGVCQRLMLCADPIMMCSISTARFTPR